MVIWRCNVSQSTNISQDICPEFKLRNAAYVERLSKIPIVQYAGQSQIITGIQNNKKLKNDHFSLLFRIETFDGGELLSCHRITVGSLH